MSDITIGARLVGFGCVVSLDFCPFFWKFKLVTEKGDDYWWAVYSLGCFHVSILL